jgi:hypothetical protein
MDDNRERLIGILKSLFVAACILIMSIFYFTPVVMKTCGG